MAVRKLKTKDQVTTGATVVDNEVDTMTLVDKGLLLDGVVKYATAELKKVKEQLMDQAKTLKQKTLRGENGQVSVQGSSTTEIGVVDMVRHLRENQKLNLIGDLLKVKISDAKKVLGEDALKDIMTVDTEPYGRLRFKAKGGNDLANIKAQINKHL